MRMQSQDHQQTANSIKEYFKRWPRFYYFVFDVFGPVYFGGMSSRAFLKRYPSDGVCINLGSGARRLAPHVINIDITTYDAVDLVADIAHLPYEDGAVSRVICDQVLEHVADVRDVVAEMRRVLCAGGYAYIGVPFLYPFHASPSDFTRFTHAGLRHLFADFELVHVGVRSGPFSALTVQLAYLSASVCSCGSERVYWMLVYLFGMLLFPLKLLDVVGNRLPCALHMAAVLYCVVRKPAA